MDNNIKNKAKRFLTQFALSEVTLESLQTVIQQQGYTIIEFNNKYTEQFREYKILDTVKSHLFVARYCAECGMSDLELEAYPRNINLFLQCIDKMIDDYENADSWTQEHRNVLDRYISCLYSRGYIDFSLMLFETLRQIEGNREVQEYLSLIKYLVVDEYQDVNDLQEKLILRIAETGANICVVGDDDQTIYQFRGSNANNLIMQGERMMAEKDTSTIGFEKQIWDAACVLRGNIDASEYKSVVLGLIFLKYISDRFEARYQELVEEGDGFEEDIDEYTAENIFFVPENARWSAISAAAHTSEIGMVIDDAMRSIEKENKRLKDILPKNFARPELDKRRLGEVVDLFTNIQMIEHGNSKDILGRTYEYCLSKFAEQEGKLAGEFYTPSCVVRTLVEVLQPYNPRPIQHLS